VELKSNVPEARHVPLQFPLTKNEKFSRPLPAFPQPPEAPSPWRRRRSQEAGFDSHLVKPLDLAKLTQLLSRLPVPAADEAGGRKLNA